MFFYLSLLFLFSFSFTDNKMEFFVIHCLIYRKKKDIDRKSAARLLFDDLRNRTTITTSANNTKTNKKLRSYSDNIQSFIINYTYIIILLIVYNCH